MANLRKSTRSPKSCEPTFDHEPCSGSGWIETPTGLALCYCAVERKVRATLPPRFLSANLDQFPPAVVEAMLTWLDHPGDGLLIGGFTGRGKTHLAAALVRALLSGHHEVAFTTAAELYSEITDGYRQNQSEQSILQKYAEPDFLFLDDVGSGGLSDFERRVFLNILERRLNLLRPTVITTNWSLEEIGRTMDERIGSRLNGLEQFRLDGPDRRVR